MELVDMICGMIEAKDKKDAKKELVDKLEAINETFNITEANEYHCKVLGDAIDLFFSKFDTKEIYKEHRKILIELTEAMQHLVKARNTLLEFHYGHKTASERKKELEEQLEELMEDELACNESNDTPKC